MRWFRLERVLDRVARIGAHPAETEDERVRRLIWMTALLAGAIPVAGLLVPVFVALGSVPAAILAALGFTFWTCQVLLVAHPDQRPQHGSPPPSSFVPGLPPEVDAGFASALAKDRSRRLKEIELWGSSFVDALEQVAPAALGGWPFGNEATTTREGASPSEGVTVATDLTGPTR
jgi:hypothetical protein